MWLNPPPIPLTTKEMDCVYELPYARLPHPRYGNAEDPRVRDDQVLGHDPARLLRRLQLLLDHRARGPHHPEPQREVESSREIEKIRDTVPGFTGIISDLGGPTANMYRIACKTPRDRERVPQAVAACIPGICDNLDTDHGALVQLYRKARALPGVKKILIA